MSESMHDLSRRSVIAGVVALPGVALAAAPAAATSPALAAAGPDVARIEQLWTERTALAAESRALYRACLDADARMPEWARPGPRFLRSDGTYADANGIVGWPRIETSRRPAGSAKINTRPSFSDIRDDFRRDVALRGPKARESARGVYRERMRDLAARIRLQQNERAKVGLPALEARDAVVRNRILEIEDCIQLTAAASPMKAAATFLVALNGWNDRRDSLATVWQFETIASGMLPLIRPHLSGLIARHVDDLIAHPKKPIGECDFCQA